MNLNNLVLTQSVNYSISQLKENLRSNKLKIGFILILITGYCIFFGVFAVIIFYSNQLNYQEHPNLVNPVSSLRSVFADLILTFYLTIFAASIIASGMGAKSPFLRNRTDAQFQLLTPVNPFVSFLSIKLNTALRDLLLTVLICIFSFGPLMIILNKNTSLFRLFFVILGFFLGVEIISLTGNLIYLSFDRIRVGRNLGITYVENNLAFSLLVVAIPAFFIYLFMTENLPSYEFLSKYSLIPIMNIAVGNVGFFFRSGIPLISYLSIIYSIILLGILLSINFLFIKKFYSTADLGDILPVMEFFETQREMVLSMFNSVPKPTMNKVTENVDFFNKSDVLSLIKKEWILIKRTKELKTNFILVWCLVIVTIILASVKYSFNTYILSFVGNYFALVIGIEIGCLVTIYQSIKVNNQIVPLNKGKNFKVKIFFSFLIITPFLLLFILKLSILALLFILAILFISEALNRMNFNSFIVNFFIGLILFPFFNVIFL